MKETRPPKHLWYSLCAFLGALVVPLGFMGLGAISYELVRSHSDLRWYLLESMVTLSLVLLMFRRKKWARTTYSVLTGVGMLGMSMALFASLAGLPGVERLVPHGGYGVFSWLLQVFLRLLSVCLLYTRQSREWFGRLHMDNPPVQHAIDKSVGDSGSLLHGDTSLVVPSLDAATSNTPSSMSNVASRALAWLGSKGVRKTGFLLGGAILGICLVVLFVSAIGRRQTVKAEAILSALKADVTLSRQVLGSRARGEIDVTTIQTYTQGLRRIDMSRCPPDFQMAYLEHIQAWESLMRSRASVDLLGPLFELLVLKKIPDIPNAADEQPIQNDIAQTWDKIERIALSYGVRVPE